MNSFGRLFRVSLFGESHGEVIGAVIDGCPAGLDLSEEDLQFDLERRRSMKQGTTGRKEPDKAWIKSGVYNGKTTGAPILIYFKNTDVRSQDYEIFRFIPRPGHADFTADRKFKGFNDPRGGGHFSGRLTAPLVAAGVIAKKIILPVRITSAIIEVYGTNRIEEAVEIAEKAGDSVGGLLECRADRVPVGLGEPFFDSVESLISHIVFAIPGIKGVEFGAGFHGCRMRGSEFNDIIVDKQGKTAANHSGGINGGITNGNILIFRAAVRPTASIRKTQQTLDLKTNNQVKLNITGRHDTCFALRVPVILEAVTAIVLADLMLIEQKAPKVSGERDDDGS